jgi:hypothetical protein
MEIHEFCANRFFFVIPFNVNADPHLSLTTSQVTINMTLDGTSRINSS